MARPSFESSRNRWTISWHIADAKNLETWRAFSTGLSGIDPALRVALTLALLVGGQAAAEAGTRLLREAESKVRLTSAGRILPETMNHATIAAEFRLQMFLGGFVYLEACMRGRKLNEHEEATKANANRITIGEGSPYRDGSSSRSPSVKTLRGVTSGSMKLCKKKDVHRENKVGWKNLHNEKLPRIAKGQASVLTKGQAASRLALSPST